MLLIFSYNSFVILNFMKKVCLIGASTVDYIATSKDRFVLKNKNAGTIKISFGGVMRNVAYSLGLLNNKCIFLTPIGNDLYGLKNKEELENNNITVISPKTNKNSAIYLCLNDNDNDMICGLTDNEIFESLNLSFLKENENILSSSDFLIIDGNLNEECIEYIFKNFNDKKIIIEAVSNLKIKKFLPYLDKIYLLKCNNYEAKTLLDTNSDDEILLDKFLVEGVKNLVISQGSDDVLYLDNRNKKRKEVKRLRNIKNTTGCGDALFSGILHSLINDLSLDEGVELGIKMAYLTLLSDSAVSLEIKNLI